jgi:hypothetical protein
MLPSHITKLLPGGCAGIDRSSKPETGRRPHNWIFNQEIPELAACLMRPIVAYGLFPHQILWLVNSFT